MRIDVTAEDIKNGVAGNGRGRAWGCPIALAISRQLHDRVRVAGRYFRMSDGRTVSLPEEVQQFQHDHYCSRKVAPFSFDIDYNPPSQQTETPNELQTDD